MSRKLPSRRLRLGSSRRLRSWRSKSSPLSKTPGGRSRNAPAPESIHEPEPAPVQTVAVAQEAAPEPQSSRIHRAAAGRSTAGDVDGHVAPEIEDGTLDGDIGRGDRRRRRRRRGR